MKYISIISLLTIFLFIGCMQPEDVDIEVIPNQANIKSITVGAMSVNGALSAYATSLHDIDHTNHTAKVYVVTFASMTNIWASVELEQGCTITPLDGATKFGAYGDFSTQGKYRVTAASGDFADWTIIIEQDPNMPDISCLANFWSGDGVGALDVTYPSYSPSTVQAVKLDCNHVTLTYEFWGSSTPPLVLELELGDPDPTSFKGTVTLLNDTSTSSYGYDVTYFAGDAGYYDLNTFTLTFDAAFEGYGTSYPFKFKKE